MLIQLVSVHRGTLQLARKTGDNQYGQRSADKYGYLQYYGDSLGNNLNVYYYIRYLLTELMK